MHARLPFRGGECRLPGVDGRSERGDTVVVCGSPHGVERIEVGLPVVEEPGRRIGDSQLAPQPVGADLDGGEEVRVD